MNKKEMAQTQRHTTPLPAQTQHNEQVWCCYLSIHSTEEPGTGGGDKSLNAARPEF